MSASQTTGQPDTEVPVTRLRRLAATFIDLLALAVLSIFALLVTGLFEEADAYTSTTQFFTRLGVLLAASYLLLHGAWLFKYGQTLGKRLLKIRIVALGSELPPSWIRLLLRAFLLPGLSLLPYGFVLMVVDPLPIFGKSRRCLHDHIAASEVRVQQVVAAS
jgi:uncharacterized RDD family membrane protein YckC